MPWQIAIVIVLLVVLLIYSEPFATALEQERDFHIVSFTQRHVPYDSPALTPLSPYLVDNINRAPMPEDLKNALMRYAAARLAVYDNRQSRQYGSAIVEYAAAATLVDNLQKKYDAFYILF